MSGGRIEDTRTAPSVLGTRTDAEDVHLESNLDALR